MTTPAPLHSEDAPPRRVLLHGGLVHTGDADQRHTAIAWEDGRILGTGDEDWARAFTGADHAVHLEGAWAAPAFVDAHVHTVATGFLRTQLDLTGSTSLGACLEAGAAEHLRAQAAGGEDASVLLGTGWDESAWLEGRAPRAAEVERAAPGRLVFLNRIDGHSAVISPALAGRIRYLRSLPGWHASGLVERDAYAAVNQALGSLIGPDQRLDAARAAVADMARHGIAGFHENAAPHLGPAAELDLVRRAADDAGLIATLYWGELAGPDAFATMRRHGAAGLAGDLNADGAIGSCTAAMSHPYSATPDHGSPLPHDHRGHEFLAPRQVAAHVAACSLEGVQAGFHCIGDAALDVVAEGLLMAASEVGEHVVRAARHRLEHVEMPSSRVRQVMSRLGVTASVQPVFDALWGGPEGMYAQRLGDRWRQMNPFAALEADGVPLALGSDGPVTAMGPWEAVAAAVRHRAPGFGISARSAFDAHTRGGWRAAGDDASGALTAGHAAHVAIWRPEASGLHSGWLPDLSAAALPARCEQLWVSGRRVLPRT